MIGAPLPNSACASAPGSRYSFADLTINPLPELRRRLGGKVCFKVLTDVQFVLNHGTPESVRRHGRDILAALGTYDGGVIACSEVAPDQPRENVEAIIQVFHDEGRYPLNLCWDDARACAVRRSGRTAPC